MGAAEFRFAVAALTLLAYGCAAWASAGGAIGAYLICGYALAMALNVFAPHLAATVAMRRYAPGTATAVLFVLPVSISLLSEAARQDRIAPSVFLWSGPLTVLAILAAIPGLFRMGAGSSPRPRRPIGKDVDDARRGSPGAAALAMESADF